MNYELAKRLEREVKMKQLVFVFEVNKRRHPAAALRNAAADSIRSDTYNSLLHRDKAIAASPCSNQQGSISLATRQTKQDNEKGNLNHHGSTHECGKSFVNGKKTYFEGFGSTP